MPIRLINVYAESHVRVWLSLARDYFDLCVVDSPFAKDRIGFQPEWFEYEMSETDWGSIIGPEWNFDDKSDFGGTWNHWGLANGICPNQPFLVELKHPRYYKCGGYEGPVEYDVDYDWSIVEIYPKSRQQIARAWGSWLDRCVADKKAWRKAQEKLQHQRETIVEEMYIRYDGFYIDYYDEMSPPDGTIVELRSKYKGGSLLVCGRSQRDAIDRRQSAWDDLLVKIKERLPHLDIDQIKKLEV